MFSANRDGEGQQYSSPITACDERYYILGIIMLTNTALLHHHLQPAVLQHPAQSAVLQHPAVLQHLAESAVLQHPAVLQYLAQSAVLQLLQCCNILQSLQYC